MGGHIRYPLPEASRIAQELYDWLFPVTERLAIVGSIRRKKATVGDIELLLIPKIGQVTLPGEFFPTEVNLVEQLLDQAYTQGYLSLRPKKDGTVADGDWVKLLRHNPTGIPLDIFQATPETWWCALVCRTGGKESNTAIASRALARGHRWNMNGSGFLNLLTREVVKVQSEEDAFSFVELPYMPPEQRS